MSSPEIGFRQSGGMLVVGGDAMIGKALVRAAAMRGIPCWSTSRRGAAGPRVLSLDLCQLDPDFTPPDGVSVAVLVAAQARLQSCQDNSAATARINVDAAGTLARRFAARGIRTLLLSTSQVHNDRQQIRGEDAPPSPANEYGRQKAEAERLVTEFPDGIVLRLTKVLDDDNALLTGWLADVRAGRPIHPFHDMVMAPVSLDATVEVILTLAANPSARGVYQFSASHDISYADAARYMLGRMGLDTGLVLPRSFRELGLPEILAPAVTAMEVNRLPRLGIVSPPPEQALDRFIEAMGHKA